MPYINSPIQEYLDDLASSKPAPGGGSAAALVGATGAALGSMVANFTVGKEKFAAVEEQSQAGLAACEKLRGELSALIQADVEAYSKYSAAAGLPKASDEEKASRAAALQLAMKAAASVPMEVCRKCQEVLEVCQDLLEIGNPNLVSDVGCAAEFAYAALRAAVLNVEVNHAFLKDPEFVVAQQDELGNLLDSTEQMRDFIWAETRSRINK
jgi:methenyltetrahydrofolate cyclohydrolase